MEKSKKNLNTKVKVSDLQKESKLNKHNYDFHENPDLNRDPTVIPMSLNLATNILAIKAKNKVFDATPYSISPSNILVINNLSNGNVNYMFKAKGSSNMTYSKIAPTNVGEYTVLATSAKTQTYNAQIATCDFEIKKAFYNMAGVIWDYQGDFTFDNQQKKVELLNLPSGVFAFYNGSNKKTEAGHYVATAVFDDYDDHNYYQPSEFSLHWRIKKANYNMSDVKWDYTTPFTYEISSNGLAIIRTVTLLPATLPTGLTINQVAYIDNIESNAGTYFAQASFNYDVTNYNEPIVPKLSWTIKKADFDMSDASWNYAVPYTYKLDSNNYPEVYTVQIQDLPPQIISSNVTYIDNCKSNAGNYYAKAIFGSNSYDYLNYNEPIFPNLSWTIKKADYSPSLLQWDYTIPFTYTATTYTVLLVQNTLNWNVIYSNNNKTDAGHYIASAVITNYEFLNYNEPLVPNLSWTINKANINMADVTWNYSGPFTYDCTYDQNQIPHPHHWFVDLNLGNTGLSACLINNYASNAGNYVASASFTGYDHVNYNEPFIAPLNWTIKKAMFDMSSVTWDYPGPFTYQTWHNGYANVGHDHSVWLNHPLPGGLEEEQYIDNQKSEVGQYMAKVTFKYNQNYYGQYIGPLHWEIIDPL